nr:DUF3108 domain-containing protein [Pseudaminobacter soli]
MRNEIPSRARPVKIFARLGVLLVASLVAAIAGAISAQAETFRGEYTIYIYGLPIARSTFESDVSRDRFRIDGTVASAGLAEIFERTRGSATASGRFSGERTQTGGFRMEYTEGRRKQMTALGFSGGTVVKNENVPPLKKRGDKWVPVRAEHLKDVIDPLSAGLVRANSPDEVCGRTVKLFDGEFRFDTTLRPVATPAAAKDYGDKVVTCRVSVTPVAGYRKGRRALDYLKSKSKIIVSFAPLGSTGVYAPVYATIGTEIGTVKVFSKRLD